MNAPVSITVEAKDHIPLPQTMIRDIFGFMKTLTKKYTDGKSAVKNRPEDIGTGYVFDLTVNSKVIVNDRN